jgi:hypothetical protein
MPAADWRRPEPYAYTRDLGREGWAWEFLRRNPDYRRDYAAFREAWDGLERDYGAAPNRDYPRWQQDPRAYAFEPPLAPGESISAWKARTRNDCVLIECAFGARWGLYKFPPDPRRTAPELGDGLAWREVPVVARIVGADEPGYLGGEEARLALGFDLARPLRPQLEAAKRLLVGRQRRLQQVGALDAHTGRGRRLRWQLGLRILDAEAAGVAWPEIEQAFGGEGSGADLNDIAEEARTLMRGAYRDILLMPE